MFCGQHSTVCEGAFRPIAVSQHTPLIGRPHFIRGAFEGHHTGPEVVDATIPALGTRHVHKSTVIEFVPFQLDIGSTPSHLAVIGIEVAVTLAQRRVEIGILVAAIVRGIVVICPKHVADGAVVASGVMPDVHTGAQAELVFQSRGVVGQGAIPAVIVVGHANKIRALALTVFVDIQPIGPEFKQLMAVPCGLQVNGAVGQSGTGRTRQSLTSTGSKTGVGRGGQGAFLRHGPDVANSENGLEVIVLPRIVTSGCTIGGVNLSRRLIVVVVDLIIVHHELVEAAAHGHQVGFFCPIQDALQFLLALCGGELLREVCIEFMHLHLIGTLAMALRGTEGGEAQVVVADGLAAFEVVRVGLGLES